MSRHQTWGYVTGVMALLSLLAVTGGGTSFGSSPARKHEFSGQQSIPSLSPLGRIKDIRVKGAFPIFKREVLNVMTIYIGDLFSTEKLDEQLPRVEALFVKEGFIRPRVMVTAQKDETDGQFVVDVRVEKQAFLKVGEVKIKGNDTFSSFRLKLRTKTWKSSLLMGSGARFVRKELNDDVKKFIKFYRQKGFADVDVKAEAAKDLQANTVGITFRITEGPLYQIEFEGNKVFWDFTLKKELTLVKEGNKNDFGLKKSIRNMGKRYAQKGYPDARIKRKITERQKRKRPVRKVVLEIAEGDPYLVSKIEIRGNRALGEEAIRRQILTGGEGVLNGKGYFEKRLTEDVGAIRTLYLKHGFIRTGVEKKVVVKDLPRQEGGSRKGVEIELVIDEGPQTLIGAVRFEGLEAVTAEEALAMMELQPGTPFREYMIENDEGAIRKAVSEMGYPHIQVRTDTDFNPDRSRVNLVFNVDQGPRVQVGRILFAGNFRTDERILANEMAISPNEPFSLIKLLNSRRNLMNLKALDSVRFSPHGLQEKGEVVDLGVEVEEKAPYFFEFGAGYDTRRQAYADLTGGDHNFLGRNLDLEANLEVSQIGYNGSISLTEPRLLASRVSATTRVFTGEKEELNKDFRTRTHGVSQEFYRTFLKGRLTTGCGFSYLSHEQTATGTGSVAPDEEQPHGARNIIMATPYLVYRSTDSYVRPRKGILASCHTDLSKGIDTGLDDFVKYRLDARYYYSPFERLTIAVRGRYGLVESYGGKKTIPEDQLFFLGGTSTVRGFDENLLRFDGDENAVGGRQIVLAGLETRYDLGANVEFTVFWDMGAVQRSPDGYGSDDFRSSVGIGIGYITPIGPLGLQYGWKLDPLTDESRGALHFSMGYTF